MSIELLTRDGTSGNDGFSAKKSALCFKIDPTKRTGYILIGHGLHWIIVEYHGTPDDINLVQGIVIPHVLPANKKQRYCFILLGN